MFSKVFGVQGHPTQPGKAQEGSQEALEWLQKLLKKGSTHGQYFYHFLAQFWDHFGSFLGGQNGLKNVTKSWSPRSRCLLRITGPAA